MVERSEVIFRILFLIGNCLVVFSLFLDWFYYSFYIGDIGYTWGYNLFLGWSNISGETENVPNPINVDPFLIASYLVVVFLTIMIFSHICYDLPGIRKKSQYEKIKSLGIVFPICACFNLVFNFAFFWSLIEASMYFPFLSLISNIDNTFSIYGLGPGCMIHLCSFVLVAPYSFFIVVIPYKFRVAKSDVGNDEIIERIGRKIDLDKIILKETLKTEKLVDFEEREADELNLNQINI